MVKEPPRFKGCTVDERLRQFRKVDIDSEKASKSLFLLFLLILKKICNIYIVVMVV